MTVFRIEEIKQKNNYIFSIKWTDGIEVDYRLSELQRRCPCAHCVDESSGKRQINPEMIDDDVRAKRILSVGRYAIRIDYTSGCSMGIYNFDDLRKNR